MDMPERYGDWRYLREMQIGDGGPKGFFIARDVFHFFQAHLEEEFWKEAIYTVGTFSAEVKSPMAPHEKLKFRLLQGKELQCRT